ncbi:hypothetical protein LXS72_004334 [Salmonella enterica]|uniref:hypothetical protein n=1 Tax=Salmonella enterica TaxID=28901 RepID=UPI000D570E8D|nr:hypothetical protein [Salmonella enterica]EAO5644345.1 hypothetical protein [Salmonella enterica]EAP5793038.1 hypothetical protein [Salmonella enterica]EAS5320871.1 hypothetical protein [Salmonella enterica]EDN5747784.1 hypothetical protein [Salmonella enterica subsp. enterica serovar Newport]EEH2801453.1 hypothetical protein [Salmonella enterica]
MKLSKELGFIRECPDPVSLPDNKLGIISEVILNIFNSGFLYEDNLKYESASIFINENNQMYRNNLLISEFSADYFIRRVLDVKKTLDISDLFLCFGRGGIEYIDIMDGPFIRTYNNYGYFMRYFAFTFWSGEFQHFDVMDSIFLYIQKSRMILFDKCITDKNNEMIILGYELLLKFNPIQSMKIVQLYYFYELESIADVILNKLFERIESEFSIFFNANNIFYLKRCVKLMIDLERVRINIANIYTKCCNGNVDNGKKLQLYINEIKDKMYLIEVE